MKTIIAGDLRTGRILVRAVPAISGRATEQVNGPGSIDATVKLPMRDPLTRSITDLPSLILPGKSFVGLDVDGQIVEAGPLWDDETDLDRWTLNWRAAGLWSIFDHRYVLPLLLAGQTPADVESSWTGLSLRTQAKRLVEQAQLLTGGTLPIVYEADITGSHDRTIPGSDLLTAAQALDNLTKVDGGPEIAFRPRYKPGAPGFIEWVMQTGDPLLAGGPHVWDMSTPGRTVRGTKLKRDASKLTTRQFERGATLRNHFRNGDVRVDLTDWTATGCGLSRTTAWTADGGLAAAELTGAGTADSFAVLGGDTGSVRLGFQAGKTYTVTATGQVVTALTGTGVGLGRERAICVHTRAAGGSYVITNSPAIPNVNGSVERVSVTFTMPDDPAEAFVRLYLGATAGVIRWTAVMVTDGVSAQEFALESLQLEAVADDGVLVSAGYPALEDDESRSSVVDPSTLQGYADARVQSGARPIETLSFAAHGSRTPKAADVRAGDRCLIVLGTNPRMPKGRYAHRIMSRTVTLGSEYVDYDCYPEASVYPEAPVPDRFVLRDRFRKTLLQQAEDRRGR